jgi:hypothetical protein
MEASFQAVHVLQVDGREPNVEDPKPFTLTLEALMRRLAFLITVPALLVAGCNMATPTDPVPAAHAGLSAGAGNDSTPAATSAEAASGGIMIGSGT